MATPKNMLTGKHLPVIFAEGYIDAWQDRFGHSSVMSFCQSGAKARMTSFQLPPDWSSPMDAYVNFDVCHPLDYTFLALIQEGFYIAFPDRETSYPKVTRNVGTRWWFGNPLLDTNKDTKSLQTLFGPTIVLCLDAWKYVPSMNGDIVDLIETGKVKSARQLAQLGVRTFVEAFCEQSGITWHVTETDTEMQLTIDTCPFCREQSPLCWVFVGIIDGLLVWLHGGNQPNAMSPVIRVNEEASTGHAVVLEIVPTREP